MDVKGAASAAPAPTARPGTFPPPEAALSLRASESLYLQQLHPPGRAHGHVDADSSFTPVAIRFHIEHEDEPSVNTQEAQWGADLQEEEEEQGEGEEGTERPHIVVHGEREGHRFSATPSKVPRSARRDLSSRGHENARAVLVWRNLTVRAGGSESKVLLRGVSGCMSGGLWAIMGPSGCGKSTLLNTLARRLDAGSRVEGEMRLNGKPYSHSDLKKMAGYVMQDDLLNAHLTVRETLYYTAALRLPRTFTAAEREARIDEVVREMALTHCQHVVVGDPSRKGISGGERRRVCIGMELLTRPTLLFMDEPTSGLDSVTALALVELLHDLTRSGKVSVMMSIHQPQARVFALFDRLILMKSGHILYQGSLPGAMRLFKECGFPVPHYTNPADHLLDVITPPMDQAMRALMEADSAEGAATAAADEGSGEHPGAGGADEDDPADGSVQVGEGAEKNSATLSAAFVTPTVDLGYGSEKPLLFEREQVPWSSQFVVLCRRAFNEAMRRRATLIFAIVQSCVMGILFGFTFFQMGTGQKSVVRRNPASFFYCVNMGVIGGLSVIHSFPSERLLVLRERAAGTYYVSAYFLSKTLVDMLLSMPVPLVFCTIAYWLMGFQPLAGKFFVCLALVCLCNLASISLALMISAVCRTTDMAVTVLPMILEVCRLFGGFYLAPINLPNYFSWLDALSYVKYSYVGIALNELSGLDLSCTEAQMRNGRCPVPDGATSIESLGLDYITLEGCIGVLIGYICFCQLVAYLAIRFLKN